jgi:hypothetical protein
MSFRVLLGCLGLGLELLAGCAPQGAVPGRFVAERIPVADEVSQYTTDARPDGAVGGNGVEQLQADVASALAKRGDSAEADGALSATASWALSEVNQGHPVDVISVEGACRHFGFGGVVMSLAAFGKDRRGRANPPRHQRLALVDAAHFRGRDLQLRATRQPAVGAQRTHLSAHHIGNTGRALVGSSAGWSSSGFKPPALRNPGKSSFSTLGIAPAQQDVPGPGCYPCTPLHKRAFSSFSESAFKSVRNTQWRSYRSPPHGDGCI